MLIVTKYPVIQIDASNLAGLLLISAQQRSVFLLFFIYKFRIPCISLFFILQIRRGSSNYAHQ